MQDIIRQCRNHDAPALITEEADGKGSLVTSCFGRGPRSATARDGKTSGFTEATIHSSAICEWRTLTDDLQSCSKLEAILPFKEQIWSRSTLHLHQKLPQEFMTSLYALQSLVILFLLKLVGIE